ncbi:MAG: hypothetical protein L0215_26645 [Gemmataceae bacterium]|nr:hypothetical protein [Gemmataceae bacterium]
MSKFVPGCGCVNRRMTIVEGSQLMVVCGTMGTFAGSAGVAAVRNAAKLCVSRGRLSGGCEAKTTR